MKKCLFVFLLLLFCLQVNIGNIIAVSSDEITAVYFFSPTCASCDTMSDLLENFTEKYKNLSLRKYDISNLKNKSLMDKYCEAYGVAEKDFGVVPAIFVNDKYYFDEEAIKTNFEKEIETPGAKTLILDNYVENHEKDLQRFEGFKSAGVFFAGLINGVNPCSISMLLFFLSLLTIKKERMLKIGLAFIFGKFLAFILLGTILFRFLSLVNFTLISLLSKVMLSVILLFLITMNIQDFFAAKKERYDRIFLQLPELFRRFNHFVIKKAAGFSKASVMLCISFFLGIILSLGEFLCTGQIYLATIITIFQTDAVLSIQALFYLLIYNVGVILPLVLLTVMMYKGKAMFELSEAIRERLHIIKLINVLIFLLFGIILFLFY